MPRQAETEMERKEEGETLVLNAAKHLQRASAIKAFGECVWQHQRIAVAAAATAASDCR